LPLLIDTSGNRKPRKPNGERCGCFANGFHEQRHLVTGVC
jgi:hypothetical protein